MFWKKGRGGGGGRYRNKYGRSGKTYIFRLGVALQVWFDGFVLLVELGQIWDEVFDDIGVR